MKKRFMITAGTALVVALLVGGAALWYAQTNPQNKRAVSTTPQTSQTKLKDKEIILKASAYKYRISDKGALGGVLVTPTSLTQILNKKTILDIVASIPGMDGCKLLSASKIENTWQVKVKKTGIAYKIDLSHYQDKVGIINLKANEIGQHRGYAFEMPEKYYAPYRAADAKLASSFSQSLNSSTTSSSDTETNSAAVGSAKNLSSIQTIIAGKGFVISPIQYDGEDADKAMNENKAPQNLIHDGITQGYFYDGSTVHLTGLGAYSGQYSQPYTITDKTINIGAQGDKNIPFSTNGNTLLFQNWQTKTADGHTITWQIKWDNQAHSYVDSKSQNQ